MKEEIKIIYPVHTQKWRIIALLKVNRGGLTGRDFLREYLPEYRTRISECEKDGYMFKRKREAGSKFVRFILIGYAPLFKEAV